MHYNWLFCKTNKQHVIQQRKGKNFTIAGYLSQHLRNDKRRLVHSINCITKTKRKTVEISTAVGIAFSDMEVCEKGVQGKKGKSQKKKKWSGHIQINHKNFLKIETMNPQVAHFNIILMKMKDKGCNKSWSPVRRIQSPRKWKYF